MGNIPGGYSDSPDRICLRASLWRCNYKGPPCWWVGHRGYLCWGLGRTWGGASYQGRLSWCVRHTVRESGRWWRTWNTQGALLGLFDGQDTAEFEEVTVYQCGVSRYVATLLAWVAVVIKTGDGKKRYNALHCDAVHALGDSLDHWHIVDDQIAK